MTRTSETLPPSLASDPVISAAQTLATSHHAPYDPSHDIHHVHRVTSLSVLIASTLEGPDLLVVTLSALFHDLLDRKYLKLASPDSLPPTPRERLQPFWGKFGQAEVSDEQRRLVERIIDNVSYSKEVKRINRGVTDKDDDEWYRTCQELHCVQDADKLDAIGAFGAMRCAAYSAISNRPLYAPSSPSPSPSTSESPSFPPRIEPGSDAISHFHDKLLRLEGMMKTEKGRELARKRTEFLKRFVEQVEEEWNNVEEGTKMLR